MKRIISLGKTGVRLAAWYALDENHVVRLDSYIIIAGMPPFFLLRHDNAAALPRG